MAAEEPDRQRDQRAPGEEQHEQIGTEVANAIKHLSHAASFAAGYLSRMSNGCCRITRVTMPAAMAMGED
jgi:hypothetical protein